MAVEKDIYYKLNFNDDFEEDYANNSKLDLLSYLLNIEIIKETSNSKFIFKIDFIDIDVKKILTLIKKFTNDICKHKHQTTELVLVNSEEGTQSIIYENNIYIFTSCYYAQSSGSFSTQFKTTDNVVKLFEQMINELESGKSESGKSEQQKIDEYEKYKKNFGSYNINKKHEN